MLTTTCKEHHISASSAWMASVKSLPRPLTSHKLITGCASRERPSQLPPFDCSNASKCKSQKKRCNGLINDKCTMMRCIPCAVYRSFNPDSIFPSPPPYLHPARSAHRRYTCTRRDLHTLHTPPLFRGSTLTREQIASQRTLGVLTLYRVGCVSYKPSHPYCRAWLKIT